MLKCTSSCWLLMAMAWTLCMMPQAQAQQSEELISKLLALAKDMRKPEKKKSTDALEQLLMKRFDIAHEELTQRCDDFKKGLTNLESVFASGRHVLDADLEMQSKAAERARILEKTVELFKWYEANLERNVKEGLAPKAELLRLQFNLTTLEIDLLRAKKQAEKEKAAAN